MNETDASHKSHAARLSRLRNALRGIGRVDAKVVLLAEEDGSLRVTLIQRIDGEVILGPKGPLKQTATGNLFVAVEHAAHPSKLFVLPPAGPFLCQDFHVVSRLVTSVPYGTETVKAITAPAVLTGKGPVYDVESKMKLRFK